MQTAVIVGYRHHHYEGFGEPFYCSEVFPSAELALQAISDLPAASKGVEICYRVMLTNSLFDEDISW